MHKQTNNIYIIGAGPAGLMATIMAAETLHQIKHDKNSNIQIVLWESQEKLGQSILKTGNGRCNFSNELISTTKGNDYNEPDFVTTTFCALEKEYTQQNFFKDSNHDFNNTSKQQEANAIQKIFKNLGLYWQTKSDGMMFPITNKASTILDVLNNKIGEYIKQGYVKVQQIDKHKYKQIANSKNSKIVFCPGSNYKFLNNSILSEMLCNINYKVLGPIKTSTETIKTLDGIRVNANVKLENTKGNTSKVVFKQRGEVLFRKYGVSGIVIFNASRYVLPNKDSLNGKTENKKEVIKHTNKTKQILHLDLVPDITKETLISELTRRFNRLTNFETNNFKQNSHEESGNKPPKKIKAKVLFSGIVLPQIANEVAMFAGIKDKEISSENQIPDLIEALKNFSLVVKDIGDQKQCQVTRGGVDINNIDPNSMQIISNKNIYVAGECVDVDGPCGGYNLHWAWASGALAGICAAKQAISSN